MTQYKQCGYLFLQSFDLDEKQIRIHLNKKIKDVETKENINLTPYKLYINVVCNRDDKKLGYTYIWTDKKEIYNLFCSLNLDGSERIIIYDDPNWKPKKDLEDKNLEEVTNWGDLVELEDEITCPKIKELLPPLSNIYHYDEGNYDIRIGPLTVDKIGKNVIYSKNIDSWITEKIINHHIGFFEKDKRKYKNQRSGKFYTYPIINISKHEKKGNTVTVIFSPRNSYTASFLINIIKKIKIKHNNKEKLIFFSQSKN